MSYRSAKDILAEADKRGMRRAFIVTAVLLEMEAVRGHLTPLGSVIGRDGAIYECGVFSDRGQDWLVVVTETGAGTHPAQGGVTHAHILFGSFEVQILVGVGGSRKDDAPIGSVVASDHVYMPYSAKYDERGRSGRPRTFQVDGRLIGIAKKVRRDKIWPSRIRDPDGGKLPPLDDYPMKFPPIGLVAPIASVEAVLANPESELEALIADGYSDTYVVEMEGYGAVYAASQERVPSILVRGVSDMTQKPQDKSPEKDTERQPIAACHAAAFAFEMLSQWAQAYPASRPAGPLVFELVPESASAMLAEPEPAANPEWLAKHTEPGAKLVESGPAPQPAAPADLVLNLDEAVPVELAARLMAIEGMLREIVKSDAVKVNGGAPGSLRVFVSDPLGALRKIGFDALRSAFVERDGSELLGMVDINEYESLDAVRDQLAPASAELLAWPTALPDGEKIDRPELAQLIERVDGAAASTTVVLGPPGAGKSALLATLAYYFAKRGWPVLAIKGDLLDADIASEEDLQARLGLDAPPSVLLQRLAKLQPVLLILDQLDALAGYLDLRTPRLSILLNLVRRLGRIENVHIVLSSRTFEFQHDVRLRAVSAVALSLQLPSWSQVLTLLEARGVHAAGWPEDAQEVMRTPQALATYLHLQGSRQASEAFTSYQAMLDRLWKERVLAGEGGARRGRRATAIAEVMASKESLWLASARFDDQAQDIAALEAAGVLTTLKGSLGFTHQTLFDHALARSFAREKGRLSRYVLDRQTSLFLRPKLWAGLSYLRAVDINAYQVELEAIWSAPGLRRHLRLLLIDFLGHQTTPTDREALLIEPVLRGPHDRWRAYRALSGSPGWFTRFARTLIADSMSESDEAANHMVEVLSRAWTFAADHCVELLQERWAPHTSHDARTWMVLQNAPRWTDGALELACTVIGRTDISLFQVDHVIGSIGVEQPKAALCLVRARLDRDLAMAQAEADALAKSPKPAFNSLDAQMAWSFNTDPRNPFKKLIEKSQGWESLPALAEQVPATFLDILWPWFEQFFEALKVRTEQRDGRLGYALGLDARLWFEEEHEEPSQEPALLTGLRTATERLADTDPDGWLSWAARLGALDVAPAQRLVAHSFARNPERFASRALAFLLEDPRRYMLGSIQDLTITSSKLVSASSVYWSEAEVLQFEAAVAAYRPAAPADMTEPGDRRAWSIGMRRTKLALLGALPKHRLTAETRRQVQEEERIFPNRPMGVGFAGAQFIGSIMGASEIARASDKDVINAFRTLPDASGWDHPRNWMVGGNIQLSREFATFAKEDPGRATRLLKALDPHTGTRAAGYALDAMSEAAAPEQVLDVFRDVVSRGFDGEEFRASASRAIERLVDRKATINDDVVAVLEGWLAASQTDAPTRDNTSPDQEDIDADRKTANANQKDAEGSTHGSLLWGYGGISIVPGGDYPVLDALTRIRLARGESDRLDATLRTYLGRSKDPKVWDSLLRLLPYLHPSDAVRRAAFLDRLFTEVPALIGSMAAAHLLANAHWWGAEFANAQLDRWRKAGNRSARQAYGEIVAMAAIMQPALTWAQTRLETLVADKALEDARAGAALTAANLWSDAKHRSSAAGLLTRLLAGGGAGVWRAAFEVFRLVDELTPDLETISLLTMIADRLGDAPRLDATFVVERLATLLPHQAVLVGRIAESLITAWRQELGDVRTVTAIAAPQLVDLAVTLHRLGPETREIGTNLFEQLIEIDAWAARQTLDEIDNRFLEGAPIQRPRLARRGAPQGRRPRGRNRA